MSEAILREDITARNRRIPEDAVIYAALKAGKSFKTIGAEHDVPPGLIRMHARKKGWTDGAGLTVHQRVWPDNDGFARMIADGLTSVEMAGRIGCRPEAVRRRLDKIGLADLYRDKQEEMGSRLAARAARAPQPSEARQLKPDARKIVVRNLPRHVDGTVISGEISLPRLSILAGWA